MNQILLYIGSTLTFTWGVSHLFPTKSVVKDFEDISADNKNIITMEWIVEGAALIFTGLLCGGTAYIDSNSGVSNFVFILSTVFLFVMAIISLLTGFKVNFLPFKLCPVIFSLSGILILLGMVL
ncbi:MAG: hypothetical protein K9J16_13865 [Melioribacteraceae bacterium]|nr:hypothetical protein [Melioribacteraceae bacterium]MCF8355592.1 hypothetical protein [Melioribacteraceae bacterium]MCF8395029.1 hypothetical protein [Melioribacteraceae bacterium]MCF8420483.1 hypothetical protein [Melioribacteraceae bacterium]